MAARVREAAWPYLYFRCTPDVLSVATNSHPGKRYFDKHVYSIAKGQSVES